MKFRKLVTIFIILSICMQFLNGLQFFSVQVHAEDWNQSRMLKTKGNQIVFSDDETEVVLSGVNVPGGEWTANPDVEKVMRSVKEAMNNWHCNTIRLCVSSKGWYGQKMGDYQPTDGGERYRAYIEDVVNEISKAGKYVILDLHEYGIFYEQQVNFWKEAAVVYGNHPAVLFGILNEPNGTNWNVWRNGDGNTRIGHQTVVETIRDLGAKNIIVAGGISYSNDLRGVVGQSGDGKNYALIDQGPGNDKTKTGNGIMYDLHMYPWHGGTSNWDSKAGEARRQFPILMGEFGWDAAVNSSVGNANYNPGHQRYHDKWMPEIFEWMNDVKRYGNYVNWTAFSFHPGAGPVMLQKENFSSDSYTYPPTEFFGIYVKEELINRLGHNIALNKEITASSHLESYEASNVVDGNKNSIWFSSETGDKYLQMDLGANMLINRFIITHSSAASAITQDFSVSVSLNGTDWEQIDSISNNTIPVTDRFFKTTEARYVRLIITKGAPSGTAARIHEFAVFGKDAREIMPAKPPGNVGGDGPLLQVKQERDFTIGHTLDYWSNDGGTIQVTYPQGSAEDGVSPVLKMTGGVGDKNENIFGLATNALGDFRDVESWKMRIKSTKDIQIKFTAHYRITNVKKTTNTITIPSTNGEWTDFSFSTADLMPTPQDTWVKSMYTIYKMLTSTTGNFEPIVQLIVVGSLGTDTVEISRIQSFQYRNGYSVSSLEYSNGGINCNDGLKNGKTDIDLTLTNNDETYANNVLLVAAMYQKSTNQLVSIGTKTVCLTPNIQSQSHRVSVTMPKNAIAEDYYVKVSVWQDKYSISPISNISILDTNGIID